MKIDGRICAAPLRDARATPGGDQMPGNIKCICTKQCIISTTKIDGPIIGTTKIDGPIEIFLALTGWARQALQSGRICTRNPACQLKGCTGEAIICKVDE
jgi:hypothetical protein